MKKSVIIAALGMAAGLCSSYGQGVIFSSYTSNGGSGTPVYSFGTTTTVGSSFHVDLYYFVGSASDPVVNGSASSVSALPSGTFTDYGITGVTFSTQYAGNNYFDFGTLTFPGNPGTVTFEVVAFNGSTYANSSIRGRSGSFVDTISSSASTPVAALGTNGDPFPTFYVAPVPEPTTLALAGLGGLASLVAIRRKKV